jgi:hypothetical protein
MLRRPIGLKLRLEGRCAVAVRSPEGQFACYAWMTGYSEVTSKATAQAHFNRLIANTTSGIREIRVRLAIDCLVPSTSGFFLSQEQKAAAKTNQNLTTLAEFIPFECAPQSGT